MPHESGWVFTCCYDVIHQVNKRRGTQPHPYPHPHFGEGEIFLTKGKNLRFSDSEVGGLDEGLAEALLVADLKSWSKGLATSSS